MGRLLGALPPGQVRSALVAEVRRALAGTLGEGERAGVAVSGGPDSVGLVALTRAARPDLRLIVLHVRHGLRDDSADAATAVAVARRLDLPFAERRVEVLPTGEGIEAAARAARRRTLTELAAEHGLAAVLLGHTAEDQAETVLLNLVRGAGSTGIGGMRPEARDGDLRLLRPLLRLRRADVRAAADDSGLPSVEDPTNRDLDLRRARARHEVLPGLAALAGGPGDPVAALTRLAEIAAAEDDLLAELAGSELERLERRLGVFSLLAWAQLDGLHIALQRRVLRALLVARRGGAAGLPADAVEAVRGLAVGEAVTVPGALRAAREGPWLVLGPERPPAATRPTPLPAEGAVALGAIGAVLRVLPGAPPDGSPPAGPQWWPLGTSIGLPREPVGLRVRMRRPGDRLTLHGRPRPVGELQRAAGVPPSLRGLLPVIVDAGDAPLWVPGVGRRDDLSGPARWTLRIDTAEARQP